jgi:hypothetical protein
MLRCVIRVHDGCDRPNSYTTLCRPDILSISNGIGDSRGDRLTKRGPGALCDRVSGA